jgi:hypothetical protein
MSVTTTVEAEILEYYFKDSATRPRIGSSAGSYIGLCSASPGEAGAAANELTNLGATRPFLLDTSWNAAASGQTSFPDEISWSATGSGAATHWLLGATATLSSEHDFYDTLAATVNYQSGDTVRIRNIPTLKLIVKCEGMFAYGSADSSSPANSVLDILLRDATTANPTTGFFGLSSTAPNPDGTNVTEPTGGAYTRTSFITFSSYFTGSVVGSSPSTLANTTAIVWPLATSSWGTVSHWVCYSSGTGGNLLYYGTLDTPVEVLGGLQPRFEVGDLVLACD